MTAISTLAITEAGLFDAVSAGNMLIHSVYTSISVNSGDNINVRPEVRARLIEATHDGQLRPAVAINCNAARLSE